MYKFFKIALFSFIIFFSLNNSVFADTQIYSFSISNQSAISGQLASLSWSGNETSGYILNFTCADGVKIKKEDGSILTCGSDIATSAQNIDTLNFYIINISGTTKSVTFRLYPKSSNGTVMTALMQSQNITVTPSTIPISSATLSTTTAIFGNPVTVTWTAPDLDGVNFIFDCADGVTYSTSADMIPLACGSMAFSDKQSGSGSMNLYFKNTNQNTITTNIKILPYIGNGSYDLIHSVSLPINISSNKVLPSQITNFSSSKNDVYSSGSVRLNWSTTNTSGVNIKISCVDSISFDVATSTNHSYKCDSLISDTYFDPNSWTDIIFYNSSSIPKTVDVTLFTKLPNGGFDGLNFRKISIQVYPFGWSTVNSSQPKVSPLNSSPTITTPSVNQPLTTNKIFSARKKFLKALSLGSKGDDVSALQEFLSKNGYYPEGLVTGYMGPATVRAIKRFQEQNGIAKMGQTGYGNFGPATRAKINSF